MKIFRWLFGALLVGCGIEAILRAVHGHYEVSYNLALAGLGMCYLVGGVALWQKRLFTSKKSAEYLLIYTWIVFALTILIPIAIILADYKFMSSARYFFGDFYAYGPFIASLAIAINLRELNDSFFKPYYKKIFTLAIILVFFIIFLILHEIAYAIAHIA